MEITFDKVYKDYHRNIYNWIYSKIRNNEVSQELANDVFIKVHDNISLYDNNISKISTWVYTIAKNVLIDYMRKKSLPTRSLSDFTDDDGNELIFYTDNKNAHNEIVNDELSDAINNAMNALPEIYKSIANLFFIEQQSHEEITDKLNVPIGTVKAYIHRAKYILRKKLIHLK